MHVKTVVETVAIQDAVRFSSEARVNLELMATENMVVRLNCYEPGQTTPMHKHPDIDEVLYVIEGEGFIGFQNRKNLPVKKGELIRLPSDEYHKIISGPNQRMILMYFMPPDYVSERDEEGFEVSGIEKLYGERS